MLFQNSWLFLYEIRKIAGRRSFMNLFARLLVLLFVSYAACACHPTAERECSFPELTWISDVGAGKFPAGGPVFLADDFGASGDALTLNTVAIQAAIDACADAGGGTVTFEPGVYLTGSLFIEDDNIEFRIPKGTTLLGSRSIDDYRRIPTKPKTTHNL